MRWALSAVYWVSATALAAPLLVVAWASLSTAPLVGLPHDGVTLRWYWAALADPAYRQAFLLSVLLACGSGVLSVVIGSWTVLAIPAASRPVRLVLGAGVLLPLVTPGIVHALALRIAIQALGMPPGPGAVLLGHAIHGTPYAALMVAARRATLPPALLDAAQDLGAGRVRCFLHIVLPWLRPAMLGAGLLAALASFDDFVRSFFLGGYDPTLPVLMFARMRGGLTPEVEAAATIVLVLVAAAGWAAGCRKT